MNLAYNAAAWAHIIESTAGTTDLTGVNVIDTQNYEGVLFVNIVNTVTAAGTVRMYPQHSDSTSTTDLVSCTGAAFIAGTTATTTDMTGQVILLDVYKPQKRYVGVYVDKATQATETNVIAIPYGNRKGPISQSTGQYGVISAVVAISPTT